MERADCASLSGYSPFVEQCTVYVRDFGNGEREVQVRRGWELVRPSGSPARYAPGRVVREDSGDDRGLRDAENRERSARRARQIACHRVKAIGADRLLTLTYRENMQCRDTLARHWQEFVRRVRRVQGFDYVATVERQKRGALHVHVAVRGRQNYRVLRAVWLSVVGEGNGNIDVRNPFRERALRHRLAAYLSKYIGKGFDDGGDGTRRVWCSKGIAVPSREVRGFPFVSWADAVSVAAQFVPSDREVVGWYSGRRSLLQLVSSVRC